jgi:prepilin-type N-terminal cleavage/methylation domain-containing protein
MRYFRGLKKLAADRRGMTLIEVMIGLVISGILGIGVTATIFQIGSVNNADSARVIAVKQVENSIHYLNRDVQMAQKVEIDGAGFWLRLTWTSWGTPTATPPVPPSVNQITYTVNNGSLVRNDGVTTASVANLITSYSAVANTDYSTIPAMKWYTIEISATAVSGSRQAVETRKLEIIPRPGS